MPANVLNTQVNKARRRQRMIVSVDTQRAIDLGLELISIEMSVNAHKSDFILIQASSRGRHLTAKQVRLDVSAASHAWLGGYLLFREKSLLNISQSTRLNT